MATIYASVTLVELSCGICSIPFAVPTTFDNRGRERGGKVWCPAGHEMAHGGDRLVVYRCCWCGGWHLGHAL
jgi:hypothetical protein